MELETVRIKNGDSFLIINKIDFDESIHELFEETQPETQPEPRTRRKKEEPTSLLDS